MWYRVSDSSTGTNIVSISPWKPLRGRSLNVLRVPAFYQPEQEPECVIYSLYSVLQYLENGYPDKEIRRRTDTMPVDEIKDYLTIGRGGWRLDQYDELVELAEQISTVEFDLYHAENPAGDLGNLIAGQLADTLPLIIWIDGNLLRYGEEGSGVLHSIVVIGQTDTEVAVIDPYWKLEDTIDKENLEAVWDAAYNIAIVPRISESTRNGGNP
jgi:ABC-type bacteriocin/lantibiotic exporter with double-glycine peptidase domain